MAASKNDSFCGQCQTSVYCTFTDQKLTSLAWLSCGARRGLTGGSCQTTELEKHVINRWSCDSLSQTRCLSINVHKLSVCKPLGPICEWNINTIIIGITRSYSPQKYYCLYDYESIMPSEHFRRVSMKFPFSKYLH